jgi:[ribosomal protein S5]-alanine N-acetyltransferase
VAFNNDAYYRQAYYQLVLTKLTWLNRHWALSYVAAGGYVKRGLLVAITMNPCKAEPELSDPAVTGIFAPKMAIISAQVHNPPWCGYIGRRDGVPAGYGGFKAPPSETGEVEIAYLTFPKFEHQGVATDIAAELVEIAKRENLLAVCAHTLPEENASTAVLRRNGFVRDGEAHDPGEGTVWRWRLDL